MIKELLEYDMILRSGGTLQEARNRLFDYLNNIEKHLFNIYSDKHFKDANILERNNTKECIRVLKNIVLRALYLLIAGDVCHNKVIPNGRSSTLAIYNVAFLSRLSVQLRRYTKVKGY